MRPEDLRDRQVQSAVSPDELDELVEAVRPSSASATARWTVQPSDRCMRNTPTIIVLPGMLHGKILRSPHPHARILSIDTSARRSAAGRARRRHRQRDARHVLHHSVDARRVSALRRSASATSATASPRLPPSTKTPRISALDLIRRRIRAAAAVPRPGGRARSRASAPHIHDAGEAGQKRQHHQARAARVRRRRRGAGGDATSSSRANTSSRARRTRRSSRTARSAATIRTASSPSGRRRRCRITCTASSRACSTSMSRASAWCSRRSAARSAASPSRSISSSASRSWR